MNVAEYPAVNLQSLSRLRQSKVCKCKLLWNIGQHVNVYPVIGVYSFNDPLLCKGELAKHRVTYKI